MGILFSKVEIDVENNIKSNTKSENNELEMIRQETRAINWKSYFQSSINVPLPQLINNYNMAYDGKISSVKRREAVNHRILDMAAEDKELIIPFFEAVYTWLQNSILSEDGSKSSVNSECEL